MKIRHVPTAALKDTPDAVAGLTRRIEEIQAELHRLLRGRASLEIVLPELHDEASGRVDAEKLALHLGVPLKRLSEGLQLNYKAVHRHPSAVAFQPALRPVKRCAEILHGFFPQAESARVWLNTPHPDLEGSTALDLILANRSDAVLRVLENAAAGVPV